MKLHGADDADAPADKEVGQEVDVVVPQIRNADGHVHMELREEGRGRGGGGSLSPVTKAHAIIISLVEFLTVTPQDAPT